MDASIPSGMPETLFHGATLIPKLFCGCEYTGLMVGRHVIYVWKKLRDKPVTVRGADKVYAELNKMGVAADLYAAMEEMMAVALNRPPKKS